MRPRPQRTTTGGDWRWPLVAALLALLAWIRWTSVRGAPWYPTERTVVQRMLAMAMLEPGEFLVDLGAGDGRIIVSAARDHGARAVGVELDPLRSNWARSRVRSAGVGGLATVVRANLFEVDLREADVVTCYLTQATNDRLASKLSSELRAGARVISNAYTLSGPRFAPLGSDTRAHIHAYEMVGDPE